MKIRKRVVLFAITMGIILNQFILYESNRVLAYNDYSNLNQLYQEYEKLCSQDPRLQNNYYPNNARYYVDPNAIKVRNNARIGMALAGGDPNVLPSAEQQALQQYQAQIANQYGVPYEQVQAAQADKMKCLNALKRAQIDSEQIRLLRANGASNAEIVRFAEINAINNHSYALQNQNVNVNHSGTVNTNVYHSGTVNVNHSGAVDVYHNGNINVNQNTNFNGTMYHRW